MIQPIPSRLLALCLHAIPQVLCFLCSLQYRESPAVLCLLWALAVLQLLFVWCSREGPLVPWVLLVAALQRELCPNLLLNMVQTSFTEASISTAAD